MKTPNLAMSNRLTAFASNQGVKPVTNRVDEDTTEVFIYDTIGGGFFVENETSDIVKEIADISTPKITVRLNSPGGVVWDGIAIFNALDQHPAEVTVQVDGIAASIASVVAMAGDKIIMNTGSQMMVHKPMSVTIGNSDDHEKMIALLNQFEDRIVDVYTTRPGIDAKAIRAAMAAETWYSGEEAVAAGLADSVTADQAIENRHNLAAIFDNVPEELKPEPNIREVERALRSEGFSRKSSERIAAMAFSDGAQSDPEPVDQSDPGELAVAMQALKNMNRKK